MWIPKSLPDDLPKTRGLVEMLARDIAAGELQAGDRLPPVRDLAYRLGINMGTVYRAYELAERRGLLSKETGRGSFVRAPETTVAPEETTNGLLDLSRNEPPVLGLERLLARTLRQLGQDADLSGMLEYGSSQGYARHLDYLAKFLRNERACPAQASQMIITGGAQQALTIGLGALTSPGDKVIVESLSYPGVKNLARFFGLTLIPVDLDREGLIPEQLERACGGSGIRAIYCMPHVQNPTTATMTQERRQAVAEIARRHGLIIFEDDVNPRLEQDLPPLSATAPEHTVYISSLSKTVAPGLRIGLLHGPRRHFQALLAASQTTSWMAPPLMAELACAWIRNGTVKDLIAQRRRITEALLALAHSALDGLPLWSHPANSHVWVPLPGSWSPADFAAEALERGIRISPSSLFALDEGNSQRGFRICLPNLPEERLRDAFLQLRQLYAQPPGPKEFRM